MKTGNGDTGPSPLDLAPMLVLVAVTVGLCAAWPRGAYDAGPGVSQRATTEYSICRVAGERPALIPLPSRSFSVVIRGESAGRDPLRPPKTRVARLLDWSPVETKVDSSAFTCAISTSAVARIRDYRPTGGEVLPRIPDPSRGPLVALSQNLEDAGFELSSVSSNLLPRTTHRWSVRAQVEIGTEGNVERVFLVVAGKDEAVNDAVVRRLYEGRIKSPGIACSGFATVGWPGTTEKGVGE